MGSSRGQALVETAIAMLMMSILFAVIVTGGQLIGFSIGLSNAAGTAATAAAKAADGSTDPTAAAINAVNQEQSSSAWTACPASGPPTPSCVAVTSSTQSTGSGTSINVEQVTLHATFTPIINVLGVSFPIALSASSGT